MDKDQMKVSIPMIRQVLPISVAASIMGIQPMESTIPMVTGESYVDEASSYATDANTVEWYWVRMPVSIGAIYQMSKQIDQSQEIIEWCRDTFGHPTPDTGVWTMLDSKFCFKYAEDRTAFVLKWS